VATVTLSNGTLLSQAVEACLARVGAGGGSAAGGGDGRLTTPDGSLMLRLSSLRATHDLTTIGEESRLPVAGTMVVWRG
jgi:hypothetical protein